MARVADGPSSEERRRQIVDAALHVFAAKGFAGATNRDVAREAGITPGLIYHYFADKRALLDALLAERNPVGAAASILSAEDMQDRDPADALYLLVVTLLQRLEDRESACAFQLLMGEAMHDQEMMALFNANADRVVEGVASYLQGQISRGRLRSLDTTLAAQFLIGGVINMVMRRTFTRACRLSAYSAEQIATTLVDMALHGLDPDSTCRGAPHTPDRDAAGTAAIPTA